MDITFTHPEYLWLMLSIPVMIIIHFLSLQHLRTRAWKFANFEAILRVSGPQADVKNSKIVSKNILLLILKLFALGILVLAISGTILVYVGQSSDHSFVIAIDASGSMYTRDYEPNRFEAAKNSAELFVDNLESYAKIGLVSFAGTALIEQKLTDDRDQIKKSINDINIKVAGGTEIGQAIVQSVNLLTNEEKSKRIILLTDGQQTGGAVTLEEAIDYANKNFVIVHTIGVGTEEGGSYIRSDLISKLDENSLRAIADNTGGNFYFVQDPEGLKEAFTDIASSTEEKLTKDITLYLMLAGLSLIFIEWVLINTRYRTLP